MRQKNAQFNTMLCKGNMNFPLRRENRKKMAGNHWRGARHYARILQGEGPGKTDSLYHNNGSRQQERQPLFCFANNDCGSLSAD
jgi:hypothetical protein